MLSTVNRFSHVCFKSRFRLAHAHVRGRLSPVIFPAFKREEKTKLKDLMQDLFPKSNLQIKFGKQILQRITIWKNFIFCFIFLQSFYKASLSKREFENPIIYFRILLIYSNNNIMWQTGFDKTSSQKFVAYFFIDLYNF